jgi:hemolysin D
MEEAMTNFLRHCAWRLSASLSLTHHYIQTWQFWWRRRGEGRPQYKPEEARFLPGVLALEETPFSPTLIWTARVLIGFALGIMLWSVVSKVDVIVTAQGKIIPSDRIKTIASVETASVRALHVYEGESVRAGQLLVELDATASDSEFDKAQADASTAMIDKARAKALIKAIDSGEQPVWPQLADFQLNDASISQMNVDAEKAHLWGVYADYAAKAEQCRADIARYERTLPLVEKTAQDYRAMLQNGDVSAHAFLEKEESRIELEGMLRDARAKLSGLATETKRQAYDLISASEQREIAAREDQRRSAQHSRLLKLVAPVDGIVQQLTLHTVGGVVPSAQPLMLIVPKEKEVEIEAMLDNKDVGFVREGQKAQVKIDTFDYTKFGTIGAQVVHVSADAIPQDQKGLQYAVRIVLDRADMMVEERRVLVTPGMTVNVDIKLGERRVIDYLLTPLLQHTTESFHER